MTLGAFCTPGVSHAEFGPLEPDARTVPWATITRLALQAGYFEPVYQPVSEDELADLLEKSLDRLKGEFAEDAAGRRDLATARWWLARYRHGAGAGRWSSCECKEPQAHVRVGRRVLVGYTELGDIVGGEAGLGWAPGLGAALEMQLDFRAERWWASGSVRAQGRLIEGGQTFDYPGGDSHDLTWPGWPIPSGKAQVRRARLRGGAWVIDAPQAVLGVKLGNWGLSAGWAPRRTGPGLTGVLSLDRSGPSFPAVTLRRTAPVVWRGFWRYLAPNALLLRTGLLSAQASHFLQSDGTLWQDTKQPWFFQWLIGWQPWQWFRFNFTHTAMATAVEGTLWGDVFQINFPRLGDTWEEKKNGPITDRIFSAQAELRWRNAPWPVLPAKGGRFWWDYAGTDFQPSGPGGVIPEISIPASVIGVEFVGPLWDLVVEYVELEHYEALWYTNGGYTDGYSHEGWIMGHDVGGSGEAVTGLVRVRPRTWAVELITQVAHATWGMPRRTPGTGERTSLGLTVRNRPGLGASFEAGRTPRRWSVTGEVMRETAGPAAYDPNDPPPRSGKKDWWRLYVKLAY